MTSERDPLLPSSTPANGLTEPSTEIIPSFSAGQNANGAKRSGLLRRMTATSMKEYPGPLDLKRRQRWMILIGVWFATFLSSLNSTLVATLLSSISSEFQQANQSGWLGTSYLLATCTFTPLYGRLCNVMGRRGANQLAVALTAAGVLSCGFSRSMATLIAARFLSGMGGGGIFTTASIITSDMYSMRDRGLAQGFSNVFSALGMGLGGPLGGLISDSIGWRWAFLLQMPIFALSFIMTGTNLTYVTPGRGKSPKEILKRIDYAGSLTLFVAVGSLLLFMSFKFNEDLPWTHPGVMAPLISAVVFFVLFIVAELFVSPDPVMAPFLLTEKDPVLISLSNFLVGICNFSVMYFFPTWFQTVKLERATVAGLHLVPNAVALSTGSLLAGLIMQRTGEFKRLMLITGLFPAVAGILIARLNEKSGFVPSWLSIIPLGFGNACVLQTTLIALLAAIPRNAMAVGTGFVQLFRGLGQVFGVAIASAIFQSLLDMELKKRITGPGSEELIRRIRRSTTIVGSLPPEIQRHARDSYAISLRAVFITAAVCTFTAYIARIFITSRPLDDAEADNQTAPVQPSAVGSRPSLPSTLPGVPESTTTPSVQPVTILGQALSPEPQAIRVRQPRRMSTFESYEGIAHDPEEEGQGFARSFSGGSFVSWRSSEQDVNVPRLPAQTDAVVPTTGRSVA